jgi:hypothetical protein
VTESREDVCCHCLCETEATGISLTMVVVGVGSHDVPQHSERVAPGCAGGEAVLSTFPLMVILFLLDRQEHVLQSLDGFSKLSYSHVLTLFLVSEGSTSLFVRFPFVALRDALFTKAVIRLGNIMSTAPPTPPPKVVNKKTETPADYCLMTTTLLSDNNRLFASSYGPGWNDPLFQVHESSNTMSHGRVSTWELHEIGYRYDPPYTHPDYLSDNIEDVSWEEVLQAIEEYPWSETGQNSKHDGSHNDW